ncbi:anthrone oxygenase family protein [Aquamicrobium sp. LC103]|uniref:anthrone oxygenase family protein n=1 Tax=Aquamicrobium sp. LC103 TaxID=1120658 RepID=UPI00063E85F2|nr:anthrone oxygenase family protein [Aquamicrobium sp. LC103]TKT75801.1 DUF1772 domain-containing protein [Aquamicrobium sp. LC103]
MLERPLIPLTFVAAIGSGVVAGIFFAFSSFVMPAFGRVPAESGMAVMNAVNITVYNPGFMVLFMGTAAASLLLAFGSYVWWDNFDGKLILLAALTYLVLCAGVTFAVNVPLNDALAAADQGSQQQADLWVRILNDWTFWNHVRTAAALVSAIALTVVLLRYNGA